MNLESLQNPNLYEGAHQFLAGELELSIIKGRTGLPLPYDKLFPEKEKIQLKTDTQKVVGQVYLLGSVDQQSLAKKSTDTLSIFSETPEEEIGLLEKQKEDYQGLNLFAIEIKTNENLPPSRTCLAEIIRALNRRSKGLPVIVLFRYNEMVSIGTSDRTPFVAPHKRLLGGEKVGKVSILKDVNLQGTHRGHIEILKELAQWKIQAKGLDRFKDLVTHWKKVFDTEELNERFYKKLSNWFFWALPQVEFPADEYPDRNARNSVGLIRVITRIIFVWFMKEKGLVSEDLFDHTKLKLLLKFNDFNGSTYYKAILQNLFFATLNTEMGQRKFRKKSEGGRDSNYLVHNLFRYENQFVNPHESLEELFFPVPFLNGGLFECLDAEKEVDGKQKSVRVDGFSDRLENPVKLEDEIFFLDQEIDVDLNEVYGTKNKKYKVKGLLQLLKDHKFTITENTPLEEEIALDPELLGRVFENLLASYNEETKRNARNQSGSFYTPREIVDYMVDESLAAYLESQLQVKGMAVNKAKLESLLSLQNQENPFENKTEIKTLIEALDNCKILDPACGSGAFPMGVLHKMVHILHKLDPKNALWKQRQIDKAEELDDPKQREETIRGIEDAFENNELDYGRKLYLIENCIYGIDIQPIAVQISKLRFFISLLVDQKAKPYNSETTDNRGVMPLPNLETKFVAANSLVALLKPEGIDFRSKSIIEREETLKRNRHRYFSARNRKAKKSCQDKDKEIRGHIIEELKESYENVQQSIQTQIKELQDIIVLRQTLKVPERGPQKDKFTKVTRDLFNNLAKLEARLKTNEAFGDTTLLLGKMDLFSHRYSAPFFDAEYMFGVLDGFDVVIGNPPYVQIQGMDEAVKQVLVRQNYVTYEATGDLYQLFYERSFRVLKDGGVLSFITSNKWMRANYGVGTRLYLANHTRPLAVIDFGMTQNFKSATTYTNIYFGKKENGVHSLPICRIEKDLKQANSLKTYVEQHITLIDNPLENNWVAYTEQEYPIVRKIESQGLPLTEWGIRINYGIKTGFNEAFIIPKEVRDMLVAEDPNSEEIIRPILRGEDIRAYGVDFQELYLIATFPSLNLVIEEYPAIFQHLSSCRERIEPKPRSFSGSWKGRKAGSYEWFETQDSISYHQDFDLPKIIYPNMTKYLPFTYDESGILTNQKCFILSGVHLKYLTGIFNSTLWKFAFQNRFPELLGETYELSKVFFERIPIKLPSAAEETQITDLVTQILALKKDNPKADATKLEQQIDVLVYELYGLSYEEVKVVEPGFEMSEVEYLKAQLV